jgi:signal peptidase I
MNSSSMVPTITNGEIVITYKEPTVYIPKRWDAVIFNPPTVSNQAWVMRVVAVPGETVDFSSGRFAVNGSPLILPSQLSYVDYVPLNDPVFGGRISGISLPYKVPQESYFVLGDNSTNAYDSRFWGALHRSNILGRVVGK